MKFGNNDILDLRLGSTQVNEVRKGNVLVWEKTTSFSYAVEITSPLEGSEVASDFDVLFKDNSVNVYIVSPTEGQEVAGDITITFNVNV